MRALSILGLILLIATDAKAATGDFMQNIGKIYVVVAVIMVIFIGITIYLIKLENKIKKLENIIKNEQ